MTPHFPIYLDYGATTPCDPRVVDAMIPWLREHFGNPASRSHAWGWEAEEAVEKARAEVAKLINADPREIVWTSGATESNNLALKGAAHFYESKGKHLVTVKTEHKCVLDSMRELERQGFAVTYLDVQENGLVDLNRLKDALRPVEWPAPKKPKKSSSNGTSGGGTTADVSPLEGHDGSVGPGEMSEAEDLPDLNIPAGAAQGLSVFAILVLVLLVGGLIAVIVYLILQNVRQKPAETVQVTRRPVSHDDRMEALPQPARKHVDDLLAEARRCYQEGRYGEAIVYLFSHQLLELDKSQLIRLGRGKTNRQYLTEVAARPPLRELVGQTMVVFEDAFFGNYPIEQQRFESCWVQLDTFRRLVAQGGV